MSRTQLKAKIRAYKYRQKVLAPRRDTLADLIKRIEGHIDGSVSTNDYAVRLLPHCGCNDIPTGCLLLY